jgi:uncharacterized protein
LLELAAESGAATVAEFFSSPVLMNELAHTLSYSKFSGRIERFGTSAGVLVTRYAGLVSLVTPTTVPRVVANDPDDDHVIAAALAASAALIVAGDRKHLLSIASHEGIGIVAAVQALATLGGLRGMTRP